MTGDAFSRKPRCHDSKTTSIHRSICPPYCATGRALFHDTEQTLSSWLSGKGAWSIFLASSKVPRWLNFFTYLTKTKPLFWFSKGRRLAPPPVWGLEAGHAELSVTPGLGCTVWWRDLCHTATGTPPKVWTFMTPATPDLPTLTHVVSQPEGRCGLLHPGINACGQWNWQHLDCMEIRCLEF